MITDVSVSVVFLLNQCLVSDLLLVLGNNARSNLLNTVEVVFQFSNISDSMINHSQEVLILVQQSRLSNLTLASAANFKYFRPEHNQQHDQQHHNCSNNTGYSSNQS